MALSRNEIRIAFLLALVPGLLGVGQGRRVVRGGREQGASARGEPRQLDRQDVLPAADRLGGRRRRLPVQVDRPDLTG